MGRRRASRLGLVTLLALAVIIGTGRVTPARAATTIPVDCAADPSALASALTSANDGDTLAIQGTCKGTFDIAHSLTLLGSAGATLDGQEAAPVLTVDVGKTVSVGNLTITNGNGGTAGGILNNGNLMITNSTVSGNSATPGGGGGIFNQGGGLTLTNSTVSGNSASVGFVSNGAGGIFSEGGSLALTNSTVSGNSATSDVCCSTAVGGIAFAAFTFASLTLSGSTVSGNSGSALSDAFGGILASAPGAHVTATNSTVSGNSASASGGTGAFSSAVGGVSNSGGSLSLISVTLAGNSVSEPNGGFLPPVGGVSNFFGGTLTAQNSLVAGQSGGPNCFGLAVSSDAGFNLDDGTSCGFSSANHSLSNTNPMLDPAGPKDNGGLTQTIALLSGSPAIDAIPHMVNGCGTTITTDQRGVSRPQGAGCDIGAFELVPSGADLSINKSGAPSPVLSGNRLTYTLTVTNNGPQDATAVTVTDALPGSLHFNSVSSSQGTCTRSTAANPKPKGGTVTCSLGNLANGAKAIITIVGTTTTPGTLTNTAKVSGNESDPDSSDNSATATTTVVGT